jgi:hypothetical protein
LRTSSPKASLPRPSPSFAPASTSPVASCGCGGVLCVLCTSCFLSCLVLDSAAPVVQTAGGCWSIGPL